MTQIVSKHISSLLVYFLFQGQLKKPHRLTQHLEILASTRKKYTFLLLLPQYRNYHFFGSPRLRDSSGYHHSTTLMSFLYVFLLSKQLKITRKIVFEVHTVSTNLLTSALICIHFERKRIFSPEERN